MSEFGAVFCLARFDMFTKMVSHGDSICTNLYEVILMRNSGGGLECLPLER
jgi:hypothetical protein